MIDEVCQIEQREIVNDYHHIYIQLYYLGGIFINFIIKAFPYIFYAILNY